MESDRPADGLLPISGGHPLLATVLAVPVLLLTTCSGPPVTGADQAERVGYFVGSILGSTLLVWGVAWAITIRKGSTAWKIGSFVVLFALATVGVLYREGGRHIAKKDDLKSSERQVRSILDDPGKVTVPNTVSSGPLSRMTGTMLNAFTTDARAYEAEVASAGLAQVLSHEGLTPTSPVLRNCAAIASLADRAGIYRARGMQHLARGRAVGQQAVDRDEMTADDLAGFYRGARTALPGYQRHWTLNASIAQEASDSCRILARGRWQKRGEIVMFTNEGDLTAFNRHSTIIQAAAAEQEKLIKASKISAERSISGLKP